MTDTIAIELPIEEPVAEVESVVAPDARAFRVITFGMVSLVVLQAYQSLAVTTRMSCSTRITE